MALDLEEQEQLDEFKAWWKTNGKILMTLLGAALIGYIAYIGWQSHVSKQSLEASNAFIALTALDPKDTKAIQTAATSVMDKFAGTPYAGRASLIAARISHDSKDNKTAKTQLDWATKNAKEDAVKAMAILQLAAIQFEEAAYDDALKTLTLAHDKSFDGLVADMQGDVYAAQGKKAEAKTAYEKALTTLDPRSQYQSFTRSKLESLN